jgi:hypothetical protein
MKRIIMISLLALLLVNCEENKYYEANPGLFNDSMHGSIVGKVIQSSSHAKVIVSQVYPVDSALIRSADGSFEIDDLPIGNYDVTVKADNFRIYKRCNIMVQGGGNTYIGEIDLSTVPDLVSSHYPEDLAEIVYNNRYSRLTISVIFTQPMDRESVEKAFSTDPPTEGMFHWGQYSEAPSRTYYAEYENKASDWGYDVGATITTYSKITAFSYQMAQKDCFVDTTYTVILSTQASDTAGNQLRFPLEFSFSTVQSSSTQNGIITYPSHGDIEVDLLSTNGIQVTFPRNMDRVSTESATHVLPASDVMYLWPQKNQLTIYTGGILHAGTEYSITIDETAKDLDGVKLGHPFSFSFKTAAVNITSTSPRNGELFVASSSPVYLYFNTYMQKSTVQNAFSISPAIPGTLDWYYDSKTMLQFKPSQDFKYNTQYTVVIDTRAKDLFNSAMEEPYTFSFVIRPE